MRRLELITATALIGLGLAGLLVAIPRAVAPASVGSGLSPAFMPYVATALLTGAALLWLAQLLRGGAAAPVAATPSAAARFAPLAILVLAGSFLLTSALGFVSGAAALVAGVLALARAPRTTIAVAAVVVPVAVWAIFERLLAMPLP